MPPPILLERYRYSRLEPEFSREIVERYHTPEAQVHITSSVLADLDHDGERDDLAGTALLQVGSRFKSFLFFMREDGALRFLENNGHAFDPNADLRTLSCMESRPWLCRNSFERAERQIRGARFSVVEFDSDQPGLEIVIERGGGLRAIVNSLELFVESR